jgi:restriction system protein
MEGISRKVEKGRYERWSLSEEGRRYRQYETEIQAARQAFSLAEQAAKKASEERRRQDLARTAKSRELLLALSPQEFEQHVGRLFEALGYEVALTPKSNDEGVDLYLKKDSRRAIVQCKRYTRAKVSRPDIQQLFGVLRDKRANEAFFVTTGEFSRQAGEFAANKPIHLVDLQKLVQMAHGAFTEEFIRSGPVGRIKDYRARSTRRFLRYG